MKVCLECNLEFLGIKSRKFCSKSCSAVYNNRKSYASGWRLSAESKKQIGHSIQGFSNVNKGKILVNGTFIIDQMIFKICLYCSQEFKTSKYRPQNLCSQETCKAAYGRRRKGQILVDGTFVRDELVEKECPYCHKIFETSKYRPLPYCKGKDCRYPHLLMTRKRTKRSKAELALEAMLSTVFNCVKGNDRDLLRGNQLDILLEGYKVAIEWDGNS